MAPIFLYVQQQIEKLQIKQISLYLNQNVNIDAFDVNPGHQCTLSDYKLCGRFRNIWQSGRFTSISFWWNKMVCLYIAGYITRNDNQSSEY